MQQELFPCRQTQALRRGNYANGFVSERVMDCDSGEAEAFACGGTQDVAKGFMFPYPLSPNLGVLKFCWLAVFKTANCQHACLPVLKFTGWHFFKTANTLVYFPVGKRFKEFSFKGCS